MAARRTHMKTPAPNVTDRALRYRAQRNAPPGPRRCHYCGAAHNVEVEHVDGFEENSEPENLTWACRRCNTAKGIAFARAGFGRRTRQYNPTVAAAGMAGARIGAKVRQAAGAFESWLRSHLAGGLTHFPTARELADSRQAFSAGRRHNPQGAQTLSQWVTAVISLRGAGPMDIGDAVAMVHATPHARRGDFARQIWTKRHTRGPGAEVPFA